MSSWRRDVRSSPTIRLPLTFHEINFILTWKSSVYSFLRRCICLEAQSLFVIAAPLDALDPLLDELGDHYEKVASHRLIGLCLIIFANKALIPAISFVQKSHLATGHFSLLGNKGGAAVRLQCYDSTICFINVHLYHIAEAMSRRTADVKRIFNELVFDNGEKVKEHDHIFLFGDLNYRVCRQVECH
jgi:hypothetical protein